MRTPPKPLQVTGVYCWRNRRDGKVYVGGAYKHFRYRRQRHVNALTAGTHYNKHLQAAWNRDGSAAFEFKVLERTGQPDVEAREVYWIRRLRATDPRYGYNMLIHAGSRLGLKSSPQHVAKIAAANRGKKRSAEARRKMSESHKRRNSRVGTEHCCKAARALWDDPARRAAKIAQQTGVGHDPEVVVRRNEAVRRTTQSPEYRAAQSERMKRIAADPAFQARKVAGMRRARALRAAGGGA